MKFWIVLAALLASCSGPCQQEKHSERMVQDLEVHGAPRLGALAKVGALTGTSMLLEVGDMAFLQKPVEVKVARTTVRDAVKQVMGDAERYTLRDYGALLVLSTARVNDRMLNLPLGRFRFDGFGFSSFDPLLAEAIREASGCEPMGTAWAGPELGVEIPKIDIEQATFERVVARIADAPEPTMWIVQTKRRPGGCIENPNSSWETGVYGFGAGFSTCQMPFGGSTGPQFMPSPTEKHAYPEDCQADLTKQRAFPF
jgi:hypothetical protein